MVEWLTGSPRQCVINMHAGTSTIFNALERPIIPPMSQHHDPVIEAQGQYAINAHPDHHVKPGQKMLLHGIRIPWHIRVMRKDQLPLRTLISSELLKLLWIEMFSLQRICDGKWTFLEVPNLLGRQSLPSFSVIALPFPASSYSSSSVLPYWWKIFSLAS